MTKRCWPWAYRWTPWRENTRRFCSAFAVFAARGSPLDEAVLEKTYKSRSCRKCGKFQSRLVSEQLVRERT